MSDLSCLCESAPAEEPKQFDLGCPLEWIAEEWKRGDEIR